MEYKQTCLLGNKLLHVHVSFVFSVLFSLFWSKFCFLIYFFLFRKSFTKTDVQNKEQIVKFHWSISQILFLFYIFTLHRAQSRSSASFSLDGSMQHICGTWYNETSVNF